MTGTDDIRQDAGGRAEAEAARRRVRVNWLLSAPALVWLAFAASGPLLIMAVYSFLTPGDYVGVIWDFSTEAWFQVLFSRDIFDQTVSLADAHLTIFWRSLSLSMLTTLSTLVLGFPTAYFIATRPRDQRPLWLFLVTIPFWTNLLIRTFAIMELIRNEGLINSVLLKFGLIDQPIQMLFTDGATLVGMAYVYLPLMVLPLYASMERLDFKLVEAGYDLYATRFQVLRKVIFPLVKPGVIAGSILVFIPSLGAYVTPRLLGGGRNMMMGNFIELQFGAGRNWPLGAALSITLLFVVMAALIVYVRNVGKGGAGHG
ncbi:ABC transporter permease [Marivibrio halodurans]|uniref:ABC transporter permease n=1 Tax=Marivibrio halodurans TaxID=2039722 RepID=A0A8J7S726_9PROT|nr:ABC transporter permease [Marivibrio halodurans]MBP5856777.1 ABC transporter permease [Marivibrio halodurans]